MYKVSAKTAKIISCCRVCFGFIYLIIHVAILTIVGIMVIYTYIRSAAFKGVEMAIFPLVGIVSGWWIRHSRFGAVRIVIITLSIVSFIAMIYIGFFLTPALH